MITRNQKQKIRNKKLEIRNKKLETRKQIIVFCLLSFVFCFLFLVSSFAQDDMEKVDNRVFKNPERPPSVFKHDKHNDTAGISECNECHHVYKDGKFIKDESSEDQRCSDCHKEDGSNGNPPLMRAFHTNCQGCHLKQNKGPVMCGECHKKE